MATQTQNLKLTKPDITDPIDVNVLNQNFDIIDERLADGGGSGSGTATDEQVASAVAAYMAENPVEDGYTPVKGTDYFTEEDKAEMVEDVLAEIPQLQSISVTEADTTVTIAYTLDGGASMTDILTFDANGYATNINANGSDIPVTWEVS